MAFSLRYRFRPPLFDPATRGATPPNPSTHTEGALLIERDVAVSLRDGTRIYVDVFRPAAADLPVPVLIGWSPYGKHESTSTYLGRAFQNAGVGPDQVSDYTVFEAPDPAWWVPRGYAIITVNPRGMWYSEGQATFCSPEEAQDCYDLIEWAGTQPWSNGKVGLSGVSYLTVIQWRVAALHPPHLAAINPWEGWTDTYREVVRHGGIPDTFFWPYLIRRWGYSIHEMEDMAQETEEHPFFDEFWRSKAAEPEQITVPAYVVASWSDQGLHTRGTIEGFERLGSAQKWLEVHGQKKWAYYYRPESLERQKAFFDHFLRGVDNDVPRWPKVRYEVRSAIGQATIRTAEAFPDPATQYRQLYLDAGHRALSWQPPAQVSTLRYDPTAGDGSDHAAFECYFAEPTEVVGHIKLKLWVATEAGDDLDLFVALQKLDAQGQVVPFIFYAQLEDGPVALGWLRASHRELDPVRSRPDRPYLAHQRALPVSPGQPVAVEVEVWPSGTRFEAGEGLRLIVQGTDIYRYPPAVVFPRHEALVNRGAHLLYTGGPYDAHLLLPVLAR
ncbi:MAG: CocE/NonD family hydrolase [Firmicutes bacterium]|nr:CocE/NonD family hydrolase [Bacillota bacterium]